MSDRADLNKHDMSLYLPAVRGIIRRYNDPEQRAEAGQSAAILLQAMMGFGVFDAPAAAPAIASAPAARPPEDQARAHRAFEEELQAAKDKAYTVKQQLLANEAELKRRAETELKAVRAHPTSMNEVGPYGNGASEKLGNSGTAR